MNDRTLTIILLLFLIAAYIGGMWREHRRRRQHRPEGWCITCLQEAPADDRRAHVVGDALHEVITVQHDEIERAARAIGGGGGTYVSSDYCAPHCPGGCQNRRCPGRAKLVA